MTTLTDLSNGMADAVERISPALVTVDARRRHPASGVVIGNDLVLTADHVVEREMALPDGVADRMEEE